MEGVTEINVMFTAHTPHTFLKTLDFICVPLSTLGDMK